MSIYFPVVKSIYLLMLDNLIKINFKKVKDVLFFLFKWMYCTVLYLLQLRSTVH